MTQKNKGWPLAWLSLGLMLGAAECDDDLNIELADQALVRLVHAAPDAGPVELRPGGMGPGEAPGSDAALVAALPYGSASAYVAVEAIEQALELRLSEDAAALPLRSAATLFEAGERYTAVLAGLAGASEDARRWRLLIYREEFTPPSATQARARFVHGGVDLGESLPLPATSGTAASIDRFADSGAEGLLYPGGQRFSWDIAQAAGESTRFTLELPAGSNSFVVVTGLASQHPSSTAAGTAGLALLQVGESSSAAASGQWTLQNPVVYPLHAAADVAPVDLFVDTDDDGVAESEAFDDLRFADLSSQTPVQLPPGGTAFDVYEHSAGSERPMGAPLLTTSLQLVAGQRLLMTLTGFRLPSTGQPPLALAGYADGMAFDDRAQARAQLVHNAADALTVDLGEQQGGVLTDEWYRGIAYLGASDTAGRGQPVSSGLVLALREGALPLLSFAPTEWLAGERAFLVLAGTRSGGLNPLSLVKVNAPIDELGAAPSGGLWTSTQLPGM